MFGASGCYTPWATRVVLNGSASGQVGIAALGNKLVVAWNDIPSGEALKSAVTSDGVNWTYSSTLSGQYIEDSPALPGNTTDFGGGGLTLTASSSCGKFYVAYPVLDSWPEGGIIWAQSSSDGLTWDQGAQIASSGVVYGGALPSPTQWNPNPPTQPIWSSAAPALYGMNSNVINFALPEYFGHAEQKEYNKGSSSYTFTYTVQMGQFNCNEQNAQVYTPSCTASKSDFFKSGTNCQSSVNGLGVWEWDEGFKAQYIAGPMSPLWAGAVYNGNTVELRAVGTGAPLGNQNPPIWYNVNQGTIKCLGASCEDPTHQQGQWTNNGIGGAVNPADGTAWFAYKYVYFDSDTGDNTPYFNLAHDTGNGVSFCGMDPSDSGSGEIAYSRPAMTFWNGKLWLAWEEQPNPNYYPGGGQIVVASIDPANVSFNGPPPPPPYNASTSLGNGQVLRWNNTSYSGTGYECSYTVWDFNNFAYVDSAGTVFPLSGSAAYINSGCPNGQGPPNGPEPATLTLGPITNNNYIYFSPGTNGSGSAYIGQAP